MRYYSFFFWMGTNRATVVVLQFMDDIKAGVTKPIRFLERLIPDTKSKSTSSGNV